MSSRAAILFSVMLVFGAVTKSAAEPVLQQVGEFNIPEANQGVGVDAMHFYAIDNQTIAKYDKKTASW